MLPEIASLNNEELQKLKALNEETIAALQSDIQLLTWQLKQFGPLAERYDGPTESEDLLEKLQEEIAKITARLRQTNLLTDITIEKISRQVLELDEVHSKIHFDLNLKVLGKTMYLKYEIDELLLGEDVSNRRRRVTWMEIQIDKETNKVIGDSLTKSIEEISIQSALSVIKSYLKYVSQRESLIQHFLQAYPDSVSHVVENDVHYLNISDHNPSQPVFGIEWGVKYKSNSCIVAQENLRVKASQKLKDMDSKGILNSAPEMFAILVSEKGLKSAIDCIIQLVTTNEESLIETPAPK